MNDEFPWIAVGAVALFVLYIVCYTIGGMP